MRVSSCLKTNFLKPKPNLQNFGGDQDVPNSGNNSL